MSRLTAAKLLFLLTFLFGLAGIILFNGRENAGSFDYFELERVLILASWLMAVAGAALLVGVGSRLRRPALLVTGAVLLAIGALMAAIAELSLLTREFRVASVWGMAFASLLFVGGALTGSGLLSNRLVPSWIAWTVTGWNILLWVALLVVSREDMYYPGLHYIPLLLIGISIRP